MKRVQFFLSFLAGGWLASSVALAKTRWSQTSLRLIRPGGCLTDGCMFIPRMICQMPRIGTWWTGACSHCGLGGVERSRFNFPRKRFCLGEPLGMGAGLRRIQGKVLPFPARGPHENWGGSRGDPEGPFKDAIGKPLIDNAVLPEARAEPIDPAVLQDDDGQTYLYFGCRKPEVVKLRPSLTGLDGSLQTVSLLDAQEKSIPLAGPGKDPVLPEGYGEAPFVFKRSGKYYFVYSDGWARPPRRFMASAITRWDHSPMRAG